MTVYDGEYTTTKPHKNGKSKDFGSINLMTKKNKFHSGEGNFEMCFHDKETDELVTVDSFMWSVYDIDERNAAKNGIKEKLIMDTTQVAEYVLWPNTEESEIKLFCESFHLWPYKSSTQVNQLPCNENERVVFHSGTQGVGADNPKDKDDLTDQQKSRSVQFTFVNTSCFRFTYNHYCPPDEAGDPANCSWYGGGNFLFAGTAKQLVEEGECTTSSPTQSPTDVPTTASPTKTPTASPTASPTDAPTPEPTIEPTKSPTPSPTASPTASTPSPTVMKETTTRPPINTNGQDDDDDFYYQPGCQNDLELLAQVGQKEIDINRVVTIVSQDTSTVKVALRQAWSNGNLLPSDHEYESNDNDYYYFEEADIPPIDHIFYSFRHNTFDEKCYEETKVMEDTIFDTVTIHCNALTPYAKLEICLVDDLQNELLTVEDNATVPKCCHSESPPETPTVCYTIKISCDSECVDDDEGTSSNGLVDLVRRGLRGSN